MDQIIDLGPFADHGVAQGAAVDGGAGADLDLILQMTRPSCGISHGRRQRRRSRNPAGRSGRRAKDHPVAHIGMADGHIGADLAIAADRDAAADHGVGAKRVPSPISAPGPMTTPGAKTTPSPIVAEGSNRLLLRPERQNLRDKTCRCGESLLNRGIQQTCRWRVRALVALGEAADQADAGAGSGVFSDVGRRNRTPDARAGPGQAGQIVEPRSGIGTGGKQSPFANLRERERPTIVEEAGIGHVPGFVRLCWRPAGGA